MKYIWIFLLYSFFLFQCKESPISFVQRIEDQFSRLEQELRIFPRKFNNGNFRSRDPELIKKYFEIANDILSFADENHITYKQNIEELKQKKIKPRTNKYLNFNRATYRYSMSNLENMEQMVLKNIEENRNYAFHFNLGPSRIFKVAPKGSSGGGSKRYESIKKRFNR